jgi:hypothetical protein
VVLDIEKRDDWKIIEMKIKEMMKIMMKMMMVKIMK